MRRPSARPNRPVARATAVVAGAAALAVLVTGIQPAAQEAQAAPPDGPTVERAEPIAAKPLTARPTKAPAWPVDGDSARSWPKAATTTVELTGGRGSKVAGTPVTLRPVAGRATASTTTASGNGSSVRVQVLKRSTSPSADGLQLRVSTVEGTATPATIGVDVRDVAATYGGDWAARARLVELTGCRIQEDVASGCTGRRELPTSRDGRGLLTTTYTPPATAAPSAKAAQITGVSVLAAAAGAEGDAGSYAATSLSESSSWEAGGPSGAFTWSYPLGVPGVPGDLTPDLGVSYDSGSIDGRVATTNNQPSWVGDGFELGGGYIERRYTACRDDMSGENNNSEKTGDLCWKSQNATLSLGSQSGPLVKAAAADEWRVFQDSGSKVKHHGTAGSAGEYWTVTEKDGTVYTFGKGKAAVGGADTDSAWSVPVFGNHPGEPCHKSGFADSSCSQVYRWNLDSVVDMHGNAMHYTYAAETGRYGQNLNKKVVEYTRGGYLRRIDYGLRTDAATTPAAARVVFATAERCLPSGTITCEPGQLTKANASHWPDVPFDQICTAALGTVANPFDGGCKEVLSPAFFSRKRLTAVTTQISSGADAYRDVDTWQIAHRFLDPGDVADRVLWPASITRTGKTAGSLAAPPVKLQPLSNSLPNRVDATGDGAPPLNRFRLAWIDNGVGGATSIGYSTPDCTPGNKPSDPATNTRRCFPVFYTPPGKQDPARHWFHKYVTTYVTASDDVGGQTETTTSYQYVGDAAWHFDRDDLVPQKRRTWGQWRGYGTVRTFVGGPTGPWTAEESLFLRGMDGDCTKTDCSTRRDVQVKDWRGGTIADNDHFSGFRRETRTFETARVTFAGSGEATGSVTGATLGAPVAETLDTPVLGKVQASDDGRKAQIRSTGATSSRTYRKDGTFLETAQATTFNDHGLPIQVDTAGDVRAGVTADDSCTRTTYAAYTATWMVDSPTSTETVKGRCSATPNRPGDILSGGRTSYDGAAWSANPTLTKGDPTLVESLSGWTDGAATYTQAARTAYDRYGRPIDVWDPLNRKTHTDYSPATGPVTGVAVTNAAGHRTTTTVDPARGLANNATDANGNVTTTKYDALGRLTEVWSPGRATTELADRAFSYAFGSSTKPSIVTSRQLRESGIYTDSVTYYDGLLRPVQSDVVSADAKKGNPDRVVTQTEYDGRGLATTTLGPEYVAGSPGSGLVQFVDEEISKRVETETDAAGRTTKVTERVGVDDPNWRRFVTTTSYDGEKVTLVPPAGGTPITTIADGLGKTTTLRQYTTTAGVTGAFQDTAYAYRPDGLLSAVTDPAGNRWTRGYDLRGRNTTAGDPDSGTSTTAFDNAGQMTSVKDARGKARFYEYDALGRKTVERADSATGPKLASWTYDTVAKGLGLPATSVRHHGGKDYTRAVTAYDAQSRAAAASLTIPTGEGPLAGTYATTSRYHVDGQLDNYRQPVVPGLVNEGLTHIYNANGFASGLRGRTDVVTATEFSPFGQPNVTRFGHSSRYVELRNYEDGTGRLKRRTLTRESATDVLADQTYQYDDIGNPVRVADRPSDAQSGLQGETQCYTYNPLRQLTRAWTPASGDCAAAPAVNLLGGPAPYWVDWTHDAKTGNRSTQVSHAAAGDTTTTYTYPATGAVRPHGLTSMTVAAPGATTTTGFEYDPSGNTSKRSPGGQAAQTYAWDEAGRLSSATTSRGSTSYLYDTDGTRLISRDPDGVTLYIDGITEVRLDGKTQKVSGTRTYSFRGKTVGVRKPTDLDPNNIEFTITDPHNTGELQLASTSSTVTARRTLPYGEPRGGSPAWAGNRGFVGGIQDTTTGLTQLGARPYDPTLGRFLSVDPLLVLDNPEQHNGYTYGANNPLAFTDPHGLDPRPIHDNDGARSKNSGGGGQASRPSSGGQRGGGTGFSGLARIGHGTDRAIKNGVAGAGEVAWQTGPGFVSWFLRQTRMPTGIWVADGIDDGHDALEEWYDADTDSTVYRGTVITVSIVTATAGVAGVVRGGLTLAAKAAARRAPGEANVTTRQLADAGRARSALEQGAAKVPSAWGPGSATRKGVGTRWFDPSNKGNSIRIDQGIPGSTHPSQRVDHVVVNRGGRIIDPDGNPIKGSLRDYPEGHIPLTDWLKWEDWGRPVS